MFREPLSRRAPGQAHHRREAYQLLRDHSTRWFVFLLRFTLVKPQTPATPATSARSIASPARPAASPAQPTAQTPAPLSPFVAAISASSPFLLATPHCCPTITTRYETVDSLVQVVQQRMPAYADIDFALPYTPDRFVAVPEGFPRFQTDIYKIGSISGMPLDVAFFAFALSQNTFTQYNAARVLRANVCVRECGYG